MSNLYQNRRIIQRQLVSIVLRAKRRHREEPTRANHAAMQAAEAQLDRFRLAMTPSEAEQHCAGYIHTGSAEIVHTYTDEVGDRCLYIEQSGGQYHVTVSNVSEAYDNLPAAEARLFIMMNKPTPEQCREAIIWESEPPMELIESLEWPELTAWSATHDNCTTSEAADQIISAMRETYYYGMRRTAR